MTFLKPEHVSYLMMQNVKYAALDARAGMVTTLRGDLRRALGWANRLGDSTAKGKLLRAFNVLRKIERLQPLTR